MFPTAPYQRPFIRKHLARIVLYRFLHKHVSLFNKKKVQSGKHFKWHLVTFCITELALKLKFNKLTQPNDMDHSEQIHVPFTIIRLTHIGF